MSKSVSDTNALLTAPVVPLILRVALPGMFGMISSGFATLFDALILGRAGTGLTAAVSLSFPVLTLIQTIGFTFGMGAGSFISRSIGSGNKSAAYRAASTAFYFSAAVSTVLCMLGLMFSDPLVRLLGADAQLAGSAAAYARFVLASGPLLCMNLVLSSLLRGQGQTISNLTAFSLGALTSVSLDLLLVTQFGLGILGAGVAMLAREAVTLIILIVYVLRGKSLIRPRLRAFSIQPHVFRDIMQSGTPTLLRQGLMSLSSILLTRTSGAFGAAALAGMGLAVRVCALVSSAVIGFGQGFQPVCGANFGAGQMNRVMHAYRFCMRCIIAAMCIAGTALFFLAHPLLSVFSAEEAALVFAVSALRAQSLTFFAMGAVILMNMLLQAMGLPTRASLVATSRQGFLFVPLIITLPRLFGAAGLILCQSASDLASLALSFLIVRQTLTGFSSSRGGYSDARTMSQSDRHS